MIHRLIFGVPVDSNLYAIRREAEETIKQVGCFKCAIRIEINIYVSHFLVYLTRVSLPNQS